MGDVRRAERGAAPGDIQHDVVGVVGVGNRLEGVGQIDDRASCASWAHAARRASEAGDAEAARTIAAGSKTWVYGRDDRVSGCQKATFAPERSSIFCNEPRPARVHVHARPLAAERRTGRKPGAHRPPDDARQRHAGHRHHVGIGKEHGDETRDPAAIDDRITVREREHIAAALGHRLRRDAATGTGRRDVANRG